MMTYQNSVLLFFFIGILAVIACQPVTDPTKSFSTEVALASAVDSQAGKVDTTLNIPAVPHDSSITLDYLMGKFDPAKDDRFVTVESKYCNRTGLLLRRETYDAFKQIATAAAADGIRFTILSATRNFDYQKGIWEAKWKGSKLVDGKNLAQTIAEPEARARKILQWSSMPGTSRHHWGTDFDINALENGYFSTEKGRKEYEWLQANAARFGFCQPYSPKGTERPNGYNEEKWHWTYLPLSQALTEQAQLRLRNEMITGFAGAETAVAIDMIGNYILGINRDCR